MGLYLVLFDEDDELDGLEVGGYADFGAFRNAVLAAVEKGSYGSRCPVLMNHPDDDGEWTPEESAALLEELQIIEVCFRNAPPTALNSPWKKEVARTRGLELETLYDCFFDVNGSPLIERMRDLAQKSVQHNVPIRFQ
jgi:hypothetical protein